MTPRQSVEAECGRIGSRAVVKGCIALLSGTAVDDSLIVALGGPAAGQVLAGREGGPTGYWPRVWAARALLYAWDDRACRAVIAALDDESWRVREMAAKVVALRAIGGALDGVVALRDDPVPRVRTAGRRAVEMLAAKGA